jgi:hypothetical protein
MNYTIYDPATGEISGHLQGDSHEQLAMNLEGKSFVEGYYNTDQYYIVNNVLHSKPANPGTWLTPHVFDYESKTWKADHESALKKTRDFRNQLLNHLDRVNPVWYASLTAEQQQELIAYRQALLDVPQQTGFPDQVEWPAKPAWL